MTTQVNSNEARIRVSGTTQGIKKEDLIAVQVSGGNKKIEKVQVQRNTDAFEDITASYANGYKVTENGTYTFEVILEDGGKASTSITYENLDNKKPSVQIHADSGEDNTWTAGAVTLTAENTVQNLGDTVIYYRTKDGDTWTRYTDPVTVKPEEVTDVTYSFKAVGENGLESDIVTYRVKVDNASPKAEIKMGQNHWNTFWNNITFGLFFKEIQKVDIHTSDEGSGVDQIAYYLSDKSLSKEEVLNLKAEDWKTGDSFDIKSDNKYVIYTRVVDKTGNRTIISSDGFVLDCKAPVIGGIKDGQTYCQDVEVTVADEYLKQVTLNGKAVEAVDGKLTITHAEGKQELAVTDQAGNVTTYTITVNNGHTFTEYVPDGNATCTQKGTKTATCKFCSAKDVVEDEMKEHTWDKGKITREATETQKGTKTYTCSVCGKTKTEEIARKQAEVDTGDHSRIYLWMMLAGVAVIGIAGVCVKRRKEDK